MRVAKSSARPSALRYSLVDIPSDNRLTSRDQSMKFSKLVVPRDKNFSLVCSPLGVDVSDGICVREAVSNIGE